MTKRKNTIFIIMACILIILFCTSLCPVILQNDTFYTIKVGEYIMQNGVSVLNNGVDPFSWHDSLPYTFPHWAYDTFIYNIYNLGGFLGIHISTIVLACILGLSYFYINTKLSKSKSISLIITLGVMYLMNSFLAARAQLVTFILFVWTVYFIEQFLETKKLRYAISLIVIPIIIANIHVAVWPFYFVLFLPYIGEYIFSFIPSWGIFFRNLRLKRLKNKLSKGKIKEKNIYKAKDKILKLESKIDSSKNKNKLTKEHAYKITVVRNNNVKPLILIMFICAFTGLLTPLGDVPYTYLVHTLQGNTMASINEHLPLTPVEYKEFSVYIVMFLAILIFTDTKIRLKDLFMFAGLLFLALNSRRQMSMSVLISALIFTRLICTLIEKYWENGSDKLQLQMLKLPGVVITIGVVLVGCLYFVRPRVGQPFVFEAAYPVKAAEYINENLDLSNIRLYNEYNYGSYLLFKDIPVFIDSRADLYAPEFNGGKDIFSDFIKTSNMSVYYEDTFKKYNITHVITEKNSRLNFFFLSRSNDYEELYSDDHFVIYKRNYVDTEDNNSNVTDSDNSGVENDGSTDEQAV